MKASLIDLSERVTDSYTRLDRSSEEIDSVMARSFEARKCDFPDLLLPTTSI